jgi:hypothetical protein
MLRYLVLTLACATTGAWVRAPLPSRRAALGPRPVVV